MDTGYYYDSSARVADVLLLRDIPSKEEIHRNTISVGKVA